MPRGRFSAARSSRLYVVGGGISGLAAARTAVDRARDRDLTLEVIVCEREREVGGKACSRRFGDWLVEGGPGAYVDGDPVLDGLVARVGLAQRALTADPAASHRFVLRGGKMRPVSAHPLRFIRSGLLGPLGVARLALEPLVPARRDGADESVWEFARRRLGRQAAERLIAPMTRGVFAGDARRLSMAAAFPGISALERDHGSLVRGMIHRRRSLGSGNPKGPVGSLTSFDDGLQVLPRALAASDGIAVSHRATVKSVLPQDTGWRLAGPAPVPDGESEAVILATEAWAAAPLVQDFAPELARCLAAIECPPIVVVALGYGVEGSRRIPRGFGVLVPRDEGLRMLGCLWDSRIFRKRAPAGHVLVRVMIGGAEDPAATEMGDDDLRRRVEIELAGLFGLSAPPLFSRVVRWPRAIPQYNIGHRERVDEIERRLAAHRGLFLAGNYLQGVAFSKAAASGVSAGERAVDLLCRDL